MVRRSLALAGVVLYLVTYYAECNDGDKRLFCYFEQGSPQRNGYGRYTGNEIPVDMCSVVIYRELNFPLWTSGSYQFDHEELKQLRSFINDIKARSSSVRNIVTIVENGTDKLLYSVMSKIPFRRSAFVKAVLDLLEEYRLDGVEISWIWPDQKESVGITSDRESLIELLIDLRLQLHLHNKELLFLGSVYSIHFKEYYKVPSICQLVDYVTLFTVEMRFRENSVVDVHAPMRNRSFETGSGWEEYNVVTGVEKWIDLGCPPEKLILGISMKGVGFTLSNPDQYDVGAPAEGPGEEGKYLIAGFYPYHELCLMLQSGWSIFYDSVGQMPFAVRGNQWIGYENTQSIGVKMDLVEEKGLGGVVLHYVDYDDFLGFCGALNPLTTFVYQRLPQVSPDIVFALGRD